MHLSDMICRMSACAILICPMCHTDLPRVSVCRVHACRSSCAVCIPVIVPCACMHAGRVAGDEKQLLRWSTRLTLYPPPPAHYEPPLPPSLPPPPSALPDQVGYHHLGNLFRHCLHHNTICADRQWARVGRLGSGHGWGGWTGWGATKRHASRCRCLASAKVATCTYTLPRNGRLSFGRRCWAGTGGWSAAADLGEVQCVGA